MAAIEELSQLLNKSWPAGADYKRADIIGVYPEALLANLAQVVGGESAACLFVGALLNLQF